MRCRLCGETRPLVLSHIFPEFLYKALYDEKHRFLVVPLSGEEREDIAQKGLRERLLCVACDQRLGRLEDHASQVIRSLPTIPQPKENATVFVNVDYTKFKLFMLSLLWRSHESSLPGFRQVRLGPHAAKLHQRLLSGDAGSSNEYPCIVTVPAAHSAVFSAALVPPYKQRFVGVPGYRTVFAGLVWTFLVSSRLHNHEWGNLVVNESGVLPLHVTTVEATEGYLNGLASRLRKAARHQKKRSGGT